jgi:hypothetical protein
MVEIGAALLQGPPVSASKTDLPTCLKLSAALLRRFESVPTRRLELSTSQDLERTQINERISKSEGIAVSEAS